MRRLIVFAVMTGIGFLLVRAQSNLVITSFSGNGVLTWYAPDTGVYSVEWASSLNGPWYKTWDMVNLAVSAGHQTNSVPMFYRVVSGPPVPATPATLLMHGDGPHGYSTFTDEKGHTITSAGNVQISTARSRFGGASIYFDGSGDYLNAGNSQDWAFSAGDFTVDFWVNFETVPSDVNLIGPHTAGVYTDWSIVREGSNLKGFINGVAVVSQSWSPQVDTWYHIAMTRASSTLYLFVNGELLSSASSTAVIGNTRPLTIGATANPSLYLRGHLDEIHIIKGTAIWTAPFTPPAGPYTF